MLVGPDVAACGCAACWLLAGGKGNWSWCNDLWIWKLLQWVGCAGSTIWSSGLIKAAWLADTILGDVFNTWSASWLGAASSVHTDGLVEWAVLASTILQHSLSDVASVGSTGETSSLSSFVVWAVNTASVWSELLSVFAVVWDTLLSVG